jgi:hypothetical protein
MVWGSGNGSKIGVSESFGVSLGVDMVGSPFVLRDIYVAFLAFRDMNVALRLSNQHDSIVILDGLHFSL